MLLGSRDAWSGTGGWGKAKPRMETEGRKEKGGEARQEGSKTKERTRKKRGDSQDRERGGSQMP